MPIVWTPKSEPTQWNEKVLAGLSKALGHPTRVRLLRILLAEGPASAGSLVTAAESAQSTVSQHLGILRHAGLVRYESRGQMRLYRVNPAALRRLKNAVDAMVERLGPAEPVDGAITGKQEQVEQVAGRT